MERRPFLSGSSRRGRRRPASSGTVDFSLFKTDVRPVAERAADAEAAFSRFHEAWTTFQEREPDLGKALLDDCKLGIDAKRVHSVGAS